VFRVADAVQPPKAGSLFFCRNVVVRPGERVLEIGAGLGLAAVLAAKAGARVVATDILPEAVEVIRANAGLNGVAVDARVGDCTRPSRASASISSARTRRRCPRPRTARGATRRRSPTTAAPTAGRCWIA
jgi:tRNA/tmRNA/rRNA uracil-C5-methylase (TrmA/RlmC/RlmD family)